MNRVTVFLLWVSVWMTPSIAAAQQVGLASGRYCPLQRHRGNVYYPCPPSDSEQFVLPEGIDQQEGDLEAAENIIDDAMASSRTPVNPFAQTAAFRGLGAAPNMIGDSFGSGGSVTYGIGSFVVQAVDTLAPLGAPVTFLDGVEEDSGIYYPNEQTFARMTLVDGDYVLEELGPAGSAAFHNLQETDYYTTEILDPGPYAAISTGETVQFDNPNAEAITDNTLYDVHEQTTIVNLAPGGGGVLGRQKIAENTSPLPQDRLLFGYSYFHNVPLYGDGIDVNRFTPGFEKTFLGGLMSFEMKVPMAVTLDSTIVQNGITDTANEEFGNLYMTLKGLLINRGPWAFSSGLTVTAPTANDVRLVLADGTELIEIRNRSVHLMPFVGGLWIPNSRFYAQGFLQYDVDANGCPVSINADGSGLADAGRINDVTFQYMDLGVGYWVHRYHRQAVLPGIALTSEVHWNKSLQSTDVISSGNFRVGDYSSNIETWDLTVGAHFQFPSNWTVTTAYVAPLGGGADRQFDGEFRLMLNRRFGGPTLASQAPSSRM